MAAPTTKIELKGAKIVETPSDTGVAVNANRLDTLLASLGTAKEIDNNVFTLDPSVTDVTVALGNITTAKVLILVPDGDITIKLNGGTTVHNIDAGGALVWFGCEVTQITASNPSATEVRVVKKYLATDTD